MATFLAEHKGKIMYVIGRLINGISLNGYEHALDDGGDIVTFETRDKALEFMVEHEQDHSLEKIQADLDSGYLAIQEVTIDREKSEWDVI